MELVCTRCGQPAAATTEGPPLCPACAAQEESARAAFQTPAVPRVLLSDEWVVRHRHERRFWVSLLLGIVTLGLYFFYWHFAVFGEIARSERRAYAWGLYAASIALFVGGVIYALARYGSEAIVEEEAFRADPIFLAGLLVSDFLWAAFLLVETRRLNASLRAQGPGPTVPAWALPVLIMFSAVAGILVGDGRVFGLLLLPFWLLFYFLLQGGINTYWRHSE